MAEKKEAVPKKRAEQYDAPLQINGTFDAVIAVAMGCPTQVEKK